MANLENKRLHNAVERTLAGLRSYGLTIRPAVGSAVKAYMEAVNHPGSLVRVTATAADEMVLFDSFVGMDKEGRNNIDWNKDADVVGRPPRSGAAHRVQERLGHRAGEVPFAIDQCARFPLPLGLQHLPGDTSDRSLGVVQVALAKHRQVVKTKKPPVRPKSLRLAVLPDKRKECCCTPVTCTCRKPTDRSL